MDEDIKLTPELIATGFKALKNTGCNPDDYMLMQASKLEGFGAQWNGDKMFHFKSRRTRLYIYVPSKWSGDENAPTVGELLETIKAMHKTINDAKDLNGPMWPLKPTGERA